MKKQCYFQKHFTFRAPIFIFFCALFVYADGQVNNPNNKQDSPYYKHGAYVPAPYSEIPKDSTIILWKKPNISDADFKRWKKHHNIPEVNRVSPCPFCGDDGLELYEGVSIELFGGTGGNSACSTQSPPCKPSGGGDDTVDYSYNIPINLVTPFFRGGKYQYKDGPYVSYNHFPTSKFDIPSQNAIPGAVVNVGIFDTGVDPAITSKYTTPLPHSCENSAEKGWNYAYGNNDTKDDYPGLHGTTVAKFIIDQVQKYHNQKVNIISVKIFDSSGHTSLYTILCGFVYAQKSGIQIINASFGFYWHDLNNLPPLFPEFVKNYLTNHKILLIAAAGNRDIAEDNSALASGLVSAGNLRNLEKHPCYPAALAGQSGFGNVIAVTTLLTSEDKVSPQQNYSSKIVDIGVNGELKYPVSLPAPTEEFGFKDPLGRPAGGGIHVISGSSYATPIVTGKITAFYSQLIGAGPIINKLNLLSALVTHNLIKHSIGPGVNSQIRNGMFSNK